MLCPRCNAVFDKEAAKELEVFKPQLKPKGKRVGKRPKFSFKNRGIPYKVTSIKNPKKGKVSTFVPPSNSPVEKWVHSGGKSTGYYLVIYAGKNVGYQQKSIKIIKGSTSATVPNKATKSKKYAYNNNYKGKTL